MGATPLVPNGATGATPYEQEVKLEKLFGELQAGFKKMEGVADPNKQANILKDLTNKMQEAKRSARLRVFCHCLYLFLCIPDKLAEDWRMSKRNVHVQFNQGV